MLIKWLCRLSVLFNVLVLAMTLVFLWMPSALTNKILENVRVIRGDLFQNFALTKSDIVFLGDSITYGAPLEEMFPDLPVRNRGVSGDTTTQILARLDAVIAGQPKAVFLKIGTNDLTHGPVNREESYQQYQEILARLKVESPDTQVFVQSVLPRAEDYREEVLAFNREIKRLAEEMGVTYINLYHNFLSADGSIENNLTRDELHLNGMGYKKWRDLLMPYVSKL